MFREQEEKQDINQLQNKKKFSNVKTNKTYDASRNNNNNHSKNRVPKIISHTFHSSSLSLSKKKHYKSSGQFVEYKIGNSPVLHATKIPINNNNKLELDKGKINEKNCDNNVTASIFLFFSISNSDQ